MANCLSNYVRKKYASARRIVLSLHEEKHEFEDDRGRQGDIAVCPIGLLNFFVNELEVDQFLDLPKGWSLRTLVSSWTW
jgi:hypothetical protein